MANTKGKGGRDPGARLRHAFDKSVAAGPLVLIGWLALLLAVLIVVAGAVIALVGIAPEGQGPLAFGEAIWASLMRTLDGSTMAADAGWSFRAIMLVVTLGGIFLVAALVAVLSVGLRETRDQLRKGRSKVPETDHIIILNWSAAIFDIVAELIIANPSRRRPRIVIMAERDMAEMEDEIARKLARRRTRIICRSGDPTDPDDLAIVNAQTSRSIIVVAPEGDEPDSRVVKTVLALVHNAGRRQETYRIVAEIRDGRNAEVARMVGGDALQLVRTDDLLARVMVQSSRQPGVSAVYAGLLDCAGSTICAVAQRAIEGSSFGDAMMAYDSSTLIGVTDPAGKVWLNPPMETAIRPGMKAVLIAEDEAAIEVMANPLNVDHTAIALYRRQEQPAGRTLLLGWNRRARAIAFELSRHVAPGSVLTIAADAPGLQAEMAALMISGSNLQVEYGIVDTASRAALEGLDIPSYDSVLVLAYADDRDAQAADTRTLATLLHLRAIAEAAGAQVNVVAEMIDGRNRELAEVTGAADFVVGNRLVSLMLARASENDNIGAVFGDLLDEQGSDIVLRGAGAYLELGQPMTFYTVTEACRRRSEVALGYIRRRPGMEMEASTAGGVVLNPKKSEALTYEAGDKIIVLARD